MIDHRERNRTIVKQNAWQEITRLASENVRSLHITPPVPLQAEVPFPPNTSFTDIDMADEPMTRPGTQSPVRGRPLSIGNAADSEEATDVGGNDMVISFFSFVLT
jgi:hypothetical protein